MRKRNVAFIVVCLLVCLCVVLNKGLMGLHVIPQRHNSNLEGREYERRPAVTLASVADGTFQDAFERYVADGVPVRDAMVLANAAVQRSGIALAGGLFGYPAYPTFYGSDYVYVPEYDAILPKALKSTDQGAVYEQAHATLESFAKRHTDLQIFVLEVDNPANSSANPTYSLVSGAAGTDDMRRTMHDGLPANVAMVGHDCSTTEYLTSAYYRTDHHWKTDEAYLSYKEAITVMLPGYSPAEVIDERVFDCAFLGSTTRAGLMLPRESVPLVDYRTDMSICEIAIDGQSVGEEALDSWDRYSRGEYGGFFGNRYGDYYHDDFGFLEIHNPKAQTKESLLIVGNSYTNCMERFFAANYAHVYKIDKRHTDLTADDFLAEHPEIRQVLFVGQTGPILEE